jgi:hypothetical protein
MYTCGGLRDYFTALLPSDDMKPPGDRFQLFCTTDFPSVFPGIQPHPVAKLRGCARRAVVDRPTIRVQFLGRFHAHGLPNKRKMPSIYRHFCAKPRLTRRSVAADRKAAICLEDHPLQILRVYHHARRSPENF